MALVVRVPIAFLGEDRLWNDELDYDRIAVNLLKHHQFTEYPGQPYSYRPPGYPFFLAAVYSVFGLRNHMAVKLIQALLGAMAAMLLYLLGERISGRKSAVIGGLIWAFYPTAVAYTGYLYSETLFIALLLAGLYLVALGMKAEGRGRVILFSGSGLLFGLATLTREVLLAIIPLLVIWMAYVFLHERGRKGIAWVTPFAVAVMAVVLPWTFRNYLVHGQLVPISTNGGCNLYYGNNPETPLQHSWEYSSMNEKKASSELFRFSGGDPVLRNRLGYKLALRYIMRRPDLFIVRAVGKVMDMWEIDRVPIGRMKDGYYPWMSKFMKVGASGMIGTYYAAIVSLGMIGLIGSSRDRWWWLTLIFLVGFSLIHALIYGHTRYRMPLMPFMALYVPTEMRKLARKGLAVTLTLFLAVWIRQLIIDLQVW